MEEIDTSKKSVQSTVKSLEWIYGVVLALSISEAFIQFASNPNSEVLGIQWNRLLSLCSFLLLVVPFYHGMSRYFCEMYNSDQINSRYAVWLLFDCIAFTVEAGLFFILTRSLSKNLWLQFVLVIIVLLLWDIIWGAFVWKYRTNIIRFWVIVNLCTIPLLLTVLFFCKSASWWGISLTFIVILVRTIVDYRKGWNFYFPIPKIESTERIIRT
ncbi:MAG: hypothetical protein JXM79_21795 [Sedimentisphaerales bacterium]|nr:hypothetical protein [Sedimentisphaerales bacterium]